MTAQRVCARAMAGGQDTRPQPLTSVRSQGTMSFRSRDRIAEFLRSTPFAFCFRAMRLLVQSPTEQVRNAWRIDRRKKGIAIGKLAMVIVATAPWIASHDALAIDEGRTIQGLPFASGGIGTGEREALDRRRSEFSLWLIAAAKGSGAYLAGTRLSIVDRADNVVLETTLAGPWLLARLEPGEYVVHATHLGQASQQATVIRSALPRQLVFYFDVDADMAPRDDKR